MKERIDWLQWAYASAIFVVALVKPMITAVVGESLADVWQQALILTGVLLLVGAAIATWRRSQLVSSFKERRMAIARLFRALQIKAEPDDHIYIPSIPTERTPAPMPAEAALLRRLAKELADQEGAND